MIKKVIMPQLGESVVEGTVNQWLVKVGETVKEYDALLEVSTDKVDTEVPSPSDGTLLHVYVEEGETVAAGELLAVIGEPGDEIPEDLRGGDAKSDEKPTTPEPAAAAPTHQSVEKQNGKSAGPGTRISPVVARMASEHNLDLNQIEGSGRGGRVTKKDVQTYLESSKTATAAPAEEELAPWEQPGTGDLFKPTGEFKAKPAATAVPPRAIPAEPVPQSVPGELVKLSGMRRSIADHMVRSKLHTSPHVTTVFEVDMSAVMTHRKANKDAFMQRGINLTLTAYFVAAMAEACQQHPMLNSQWTDEGIYLHNSVNIGMATAIDEGLIVPVIKNAQDLNLSGIARQVNDLANRARHKQLNPDEVQGGTITLTNHGVSGSLFATPIINQPQAAIMGVGIIEKRVKVINDAIAIRPSCYVSLTFDHRIADGAVGDAWLMVIKQTLENWT